MVQQIVLLIHHVTHPTVETHLKNLDPMSHISARVPHLPLCRNRRAASASARLSRAPPDPIRYRPDRLAYPGKSPRPPPGSLPYPLARSPPPWLYPIAPLKLFCRRRRPRFAAVVSGAGTFAPAALAPPAATRLRHEEAAQRTGKASRRRGAWLRIRCAAAGSGPFVAGSGPSPPDLAGELTERSTAAGGVRTAAFGGGDGRRETRATARLAGETPVAAADDIGRGAGVVGGEAGGWLGAADVLGRRWAKSRGGRVAAAYLVVAASVEARAVLLRRRAWWWLRSSPNTRCSTPSVASPRSSVGGDGRPRDQRDDVVQDMIVIGNGPGRLDYWIGEAVESFTTEDKMEVGLQGCHALQ
ncbi:hypothetical protein DAI22_03g342600 [Oryza sativa Japonica Group]|nr:hypothetical protein DAI22_03g342600 [Oryza sativa Japonica Group]KAF2941383.1 hypothetical protein DAI22_03g342600 [Oryza sativa Japonica Group]